MQGSIPVGYSVWFTDEDGELELWATTNDTRSMLAELKAVQQAMPGRECSVTEDYIDGTRNLIITMEKTT